LQAVHERWIQNLGFGGVLFLSVLYTLSALFFLPAGPLALAAGYMFGIWWGFLAAVLGYHVGGTVAFFVARYLLRDWAIKQISKWPKVKAIEHAITAEKDAAWKIVSLVRLSPLLPFAPSNYFFAITEVSYAIYLSGTFIGIVIPLLVAVYLGTTIKTLSDVVSGSIDEKQRPLYYTILICGSIGAIVVTIYVSILAKRAIEKHIKQAELLHEDTVYVAASDTEILVPKQNDELNNIVNNSNNSEQKDNS